MWNCVTLMESLKWGTDDDARAAQRISRISDA